MAVLLVLAFLSPLGLGGCAGKHEQREDARHAAFQTAAEARFRQLESRIEQLEQHRTMMEARLAMQAQRIAALEQRDDMREAQIQALSQALDRQRAKASSAPSPRKQAGRKPSPRPAATKLPLPAPAAPDPAELARKEAEKNAYTAAWLALKGGRFEEATQGFTALLRDYPDGEYADQAWYWLGESRAARKEMKQAARAFRTVVKQYPKSVKRPAALLRLGDIAREAGKIDRARKRYAQLLKEYPDSPAAGQARRALRLLESSRNDPSPKGGTR